MMLAGVTIYVSITRVTYVLQVLLPLPFRLPLFLPCLFPLRLPLIILLLPSFHLPLPHFLPLFALVSLLSLDNFSPLSTSNSCSCTFTCPTSFPVPFLQLSARLITSMLFPLIQQLPTSMFTKHSCPCYLFLPVPFVPGNTPPTPELYYTRPNSHIQ